MSIYPDKSAALQRLLSECIRDGLESLGPGMAQTIFYHIEQREGVGRRDVTQDIDLLTEGLQLMFGEGVRIVEGLIVEKIGEKLGLKGMFSAGKTLQDCVEEARIILLLKRQRPSYNT